MSGGGQTTVRMEAKNCGGSQLNQNIPTTSTWTQITIANINVSNTQCTIGFWSVAGANQWMNFDDVEFYANSGPTATPTATSTGGLTMRGADVSSLKRAKDQGQIYYNASGVAQAHC